MERYAFSYQKSNSEEYKDMFGAESSEMTAVHNYPEGSSWPTQLQDFIAFLSATYGYNVSDRVFIKDKGTGDITCINDYDRYY